MPYNALRLICVLIRHLSTVRALCGRLLLRILCRLSFLEGHETVKSHRKEMTRNEEKPTLLPTKLDATCGYTVPCSLVQVELQEENMDVIYDSVPAVRLNEATSASSPGASISFARWRASYSLSS